MNRLRGESAANLKFLLALFCLSLFFIPLIPVTVVPEINLMIVDEDGSSIPNANITQVWRHYTYQFGDDREDVFSDSKGVARFPERIERFSVVHLAFGKAVETININPHASFGPSSFFLPRGDVSGFASYRPHWPIPTVMVVKR